MKTISKNIKYKIGDIIFPAYNGTSRFFKKPRWDIVYKVDKKGKPIGYFTVWDYSIIRTIRIIQKLEKLKNENKN